MRRASDFHWGQQQVAGTSPFHQNQTNVVAEQNNGKKKRGKHASSKDRNTAKATEATRSGEVAASPPTLRPQGFGGYLPSGFPTIGEHGPQGSIITSPVLEALGSNADSAYRTDVWAQSVPVGKSPPTDLLGGISISGSPPNFAPSNVSERGGFTHTPPSSPPLAKARPASYAAGNPLQKSRPSSHDKMARPSFGSQLPQPPLPHHAQAHFYGAPNIDLGLGGINLHDPSRENVSFAKFDIVGQPVSTKGARLHRVALVGSNNRIDVISFQHHKPKAVGCIDDLKGQVIDAQVLTWESGPDPFASLRPLVALVIHGPKTEINPVPTPTATEEDLELESSEILPEVPLPNKLHENAVQNQDLEVHTRVDVYSLRSQKYISTLFATQSQRVEPSFRGLPTTNPPPMGNLQLAVSGNFVFVTSASSGEIYIYTVNEVADATFQCLGKFWTTVQTRDIRRYSSSSASTDASPSPADLSRPTTNPEQPLMTVSARWLAIVPPGGASKTSIQGHVPLSLISGKPPGLDSFTAPPKPSNTCSIESPDVNSIFNRVARGMAQEVVKGARWMGDQGLQAWNNYWGRDSTSSQTHSPLPARSQAPSIPASYFPPTHGLETQSPSSNDPELVSLVDLSRLNAPQNRQHHQLSEPFATFQPPNGCSYISFSPSGLSILTSSKKGDIQYVWDLMQVVHQRMAALVTKFPSGDPDPAALMPLARQIARFTRLSSASITDVVWSKPPSYRLAVVTRNGTVHVFDIPSSASMWPPPRQLIKQPTSVSDPVGSPVNEKGDPLASEGLLASAWKVAGRAQPMLASLRGRTPSFGTTFSGIGTNSIGFASATGVKGGKAVAAGLSKSVGAASGTVNTIRHAGENRLHLASLAKDPSPRRVCWHIGDREELALSIIDGSAFKKYWVRRSTSTAARGQRSKISSVIDVKRPVEARLPTLENLRYASEAAQTQKYGGFEEPKPQASGYWSLPVTNTTSQSNVFSHSHPLSHAEIETNSPYQPFHSDRRVNLAVYADPPSATEPETDPTVSAILSPLSDAPNQPSNLSSLGAKGEPWVFGNKIPVQPLNLRSASFADDLEDGNSIIYRETATANRTPRPGEEPADEVVITTRKRRGKTVVGENAGMSTTLGVTGEDEDFFEEDLEIVDWAGDRV